ncbi:MAG TPA: DsbA family oxidoreductase [Acidimicrobiales bacterium]|nr:DsbA family oxidoreductase [Acidimicrobiales bacterium]
MKVEIFSDVVCPWCAIGKARFEAALARFEHAAEVEVRFRSFELDPNAPRSSGVDSATHLANKYGMSREQAVASQQRLAEVAAEEGLEFHFDQTRRGNTFDAHRLLHLAGEVGVQGALKERLMRAYFADGEPIGERATLVRLGAEVGLSAEKSDEMLSGERYCAEVRADEQAARDLGINGVPFFVLDGRYGVSGAQSPETFLAALETAWREGAAEVESAGEVCGAQSCEVPPAP